MSSDRDRASERVATDRAGLCRAMSKRGKPCGKKAAKDGLCLVHSGEQDMKAIGRVGGRASAKAKRRGADAEREGYRAHLRRELDPAELTAAIKTGLASSSERDRLAAAKVAFAELGEPVAEREREQQADVAEAKEKLMARLDEMAVRRDVRTLAEQGVARPDSGRSRSPAQPFEGVVMFDLRELAEWAATWALPGPLSVADVACGGCGKAGVRVVKEGEAVDEGPVYCAACRPAEEREAEASSLAPGTPLVTVPDPPADEPLRRRSLA